MHTVCEASWSVLSVLLWRNLWAELRGYVDRAGGVEEGGSIKRPFTEEQVDDILKHCDVKSGMVDYAQMVNVRDSRLRADSVPWRQLFRSPGDSPGEMNGWSFRRVRCIVQCQSAARSPPAMS